MQSESTLNFREYQLRAFQTIKNHDSRDLALCDWALGLGGEAGEVQELVKHAVMHKEPIKIPELAKELGDVLWYVAAICAHFHLDMGVIAELNVAKLNHRHGTQFTQEGTNNRHEREAKFSDTPVYRELLERLEVVDGGL